MSYSSLVVKQSGLTIWCHTESKTVVRKKKSTVKIYIIRFGGEDVLMLHGIIVGITDCLHKLVNYS